MKGVSILLKRAFTMIELMICVTIISLISALTFTSYTEILYTLDEVYSTTEEIEIIVKDGMNYEYN